MFFEFRYDDAISKRIIPAEVAPLEESVLYYCQSAALWFHSPDHTKIEELFQNLREGLRFLDLADPTLKERSAKALFKVAKMDPPAQIPSSEPIAELVDKQK